MAEFLEQTWLGNPVLAWLLALAVVAGVMLLFPILRAWVFRGSKRWLGDSRAAVALPALLIDRIGPTLRVILALYLGQQLLALPPRIDRAFDIIIIIGAWYQVAVWAAAILRFYMERRQPQDLDGDGIADHSPAVSVVLFLGQVVIWAIVLLLALSNLGVNVTGLVAGLGIGGIAVALAVQTILGDLLSSLSIAFDKPFMVGDLLRIDAIEGTVEHVGVRSTRLRSVNGEQIIIANGDLLKSRIHNLGRMAERRSVSRLYIQYESTPEQIGQVSSLVEAAVREQPGARFDSCLLVQLGTYALEFEVIYFVANRGDALPRVTIDAVNHGMFQRLSTAGIRMAYPVTRRIADLPVQADPPA